MAKRERTSFWSRLKNPPNWIAIMSFISSFVIFPLAIITSFLDDWLNLYAILACAFCVVPFLYTLFIIIVFFVRMFKKLLKEADKYAFTRQLHKSYEFRSMFFAVCTFVSNVGYTAFLSSLALIVRSLWFGALAVYYILLTSARGGVLLQNIRDERRFKEDEFALQSAKAGTYRYCGGMMIALTLAMAISVVHTMVVGVSAQSLPEWTVYFFAGYAAYRVVASIVSFVRATTKDDLAVRAVKYINLAAALVSVFTLQTAIFNAFFNSYDPIIFNAISGFSVCFIMLVLGVYIISFSSIVRKNLKARQAKVAAEEQAESLYNREGYDEEYGANAVYLEEQETEEMAVLEGSVGEVIAVTETAVDGGEEYDENGAAEEDSAGNENIAE